MLVCALPLARCHVYRLRPPEHRGAWQASAKPRPRPGGSSGLGLISLGSQTPPKHTRTSPASIRAGQYNTALCTRSLGLSSHVAPFHWLPSDACRSLMEHVIPWPRFASSDAWLWTAAHRLQSPQMAWNAMFLYINASHGFPPIANPTTVASSLHFSRRQSAVSLVETQPRCPVSHSTTMFLPLAPSLPC